MILAGILMLDYIGYSDGSKKLENALASVIKEGVYVTYDFKEKDDNSSVGTKEMGDAIIRKLKGG